MDKQPALRSARLMRDARPLAKPSIEQSMVRAVFLDRDGVLNRNVFYPDTQAWESPRTVDAVELTNGVIAALRSLRDAGYLLILVSNQPNAAKAKCSLEALNQVQARLTSLLAAEGIMLDANFLCFHHPDHTGPCVCRKPSPFFLFQASAAYGIDLGQSWMIGDRETDVLCGLAAGTRTAWIDNGEGVSAPDARCAATVMAPNVPEAVALLLALSLPEAKGDRKRAGCEKVRRPCTLSCTIG